MELVGSPVVYFSSKAASLMNTMLPLVKYENSDGSTKKDPVLTFDYSTKTIESE